jgi:hypothetical protein
MDSLLIISRVMIRIIKIFSLKNKKSENIWKSKILINQIRNKRKVAERDSKIDFNKSGFFRLKVINR